MNHTPGPWTAAIYAGLYDQPLVSCESGAIARIVSQDDRVHEANALLIAAAPDLLAALQQMERAFKIRGNCGFSKEACMINAAITRATKG